MKRKPTEEQRQSRKLKREMRATVRSSTIESHTHSLSMHPLVGVLDCCERCIYCVLTDEDVGVTPYTLIPSGLVQTAPALRVLVGLPVHIDDLVVRRKYGEDMQPRHAVLLLSTDHIAEFIEEFAPFAFCAFLDVRRVPAQISDLHIGWIYQALTEVSIDAIVGSWRSSATEAIERVRRYWNDAEYTPLRDLAPQLVKPALGATLDLVPFPPQDCIEPNGLLANLMRVGYCDAVFESATAAPINLENIDAVQRAQIDLAEAVRLNEAQVPTYLVAPSPNPYFVRQLETIGRRRPGTKSLVESLLHERSFIFHSNSDEIAVADRKDIAVLLGTRVAERRWVDAVTNAASAARGAVLFRTPQLPASLYERLEAVAQMTWTEATKMRSMVKWDRLCDELTSAVGPSLLRWIATNSRRVTLVSDLPLEWCKVDDIPLGFLRPVCRIPMALGSCLGAFLRELRPPSVWKEMRQVRVMVVNGHSNEDPLGVFPHLLAKQSEELGFPTQYCEAATEGALVEAIDRFHPRLLILSAHGIVKGDSGAAIALAGSRTPLNLSRLAWRPDAAILSACRSEAVVRTFGSPASNLYANGIRAVVGSYLNLTEPHATMMVSAMLVNIREAVEGRSPLSNLHDVISMTLMMRRPVDILVAAERWYRREHREGSPMELFEKYTQWHNAQAERDIPSSWSGVIDQLVDLARETPYAASVEAMKLSRAFRPESMFYTQIGEPHQIILGGTRFRSTANADLGAVARLPNG